MIPMVSTTSPTTTTGLFYVAYGDDVTRASSTFTITYSDDLPEPDQLPIVAPRRLFYAASTRAERVQHPPRNVRRERRPMRAPHIALRHARRRGPAVEKTL